MSKSYQQLYSDALMKINEYARIHNAVKSTKLVEAAMRVINRHDLAREFADELVIVMTETETKD